MKLIKDISITYKGYLQQAWLNGDISDKRDVASLADLFRNISNFRNSSVPTFYIIDYSNNSYLLMSDAIKTISDYDAREFLESGLKKTVEVFNADDFKVFNQKIFNENLNILKQTSHEEHKHLSFSYNWRIKCRNKKLANLLQKGFYVTDEKTKLPKYSIGTITDITDIFSQENMMSHLVQKDVIIRGVKQKQTLIKNYFYTNEESNQLSKQEHIVLLCLADGLSSKQIGEKLKISANTVNNHRQSLLIKTNTNNVAQLIAYAVRSRLI